MAPAQAQIDLPDVRTESHSQWLREAKGKTPFRLFVTTSGYESRNTHWLSKTESAISVDSRTQHLVIGFREFADALHRPDNDRFYRDRTLPVQIADAEEGLVFCEDIDKAIKAVLSAANNEPIEVHVDYSCMPRLWYCSLPELLLKILRPHDRAFLWYTPGEYPDAEYPTAGIEDFKLFSGRPSLNPPARTHIFGLGFDRVRSQAIWSVIDPQNLVCFYADPAIKSSYAERVKSDNRDVLAAANHTFTVPVNDFIYAYGLIAAIVTEFRSVGDVVIVPDGPKPLILASSLIPMRLEVPGVLCFHVTRRKGRSYKPIDVTVGGEPFGLSFSGRKNAPSSLCEQLPTTSP